MQLTTFVLRIREADGTYAVGAMDLPTGTSIEQAIETAVDDIGPGQRIERITNADTKESLTLRSIARSPRGFA